MPNLNDWIKAQLKRGYKDKQIKQILASKGYPPSAVAQVDRVRYRASSVKIAPGNKIPKKTPYSLILILAVVVVVIGVVYFMGGDKGDEERETETGESSPPTILQSEFKPVEELCKDYSVVENEISCENAVNTALETYPGEVYSINKTQIFPLQEGQDSTEKFWAVGINLDEPIEKELPAGSFVSRVDVFISVDIGTISVIRFS